jgi:hypothetical protein
MVEPPREGEPGLTEFQRVAAEVQLEARLRVAGSARVAFQSGHKIAPEK